MFSNLPVKAVRCLVSMEMSYRITESDQKRASRIVLQHVAVVKHKRAETNRGNRERQRDISFADILGPSEAISPW